LLHHNQLFYRFQQFCQLLRGGNNLGAYDFKLKAFATVLQSTHLGVIRRGRHQANAIVANPRGQRWFPNGTALSRSPIWRLVLRLRLPVPLNGLVLGLNKIFRVGASISSTGKGLGLGVVGHGFAGGRPERNPVRPRCL